MKIEVLKSKIKRLTILESNINYEGSLTLCPLIIQQAGLREYQRVDVNNLTNGNRDNTYILKSSKKDMVAINGALSKRHKVGDIIHVNAYGLVDKNENFKPIII